MATIVTRMGDGYAVEFTADELHRELVEGSEDAARRGKVPPLEERELEHLHDLFAFPGRVVGVRPGNECILSKDGSGNTLYSAQLSSGVGLPLAREQAVRTFERAFGFDTFEVGHPDYSYKAVKPIVALERTTMESCLQTTILPLFYGAMPNLGLYSQPDGPFPNPSALLPMGKVAEARAAQEEAAAACTADIVFMARHMAAAGADGLNLDTTAAAGDAEFLAALQAAETVSGELSLPVEMGMAAECVLGFHGELSYAGTRLAGLWPHQQVKLAEKAGVAVFGPVVNTNTRRSTPWNVARACAFVKACSEAAEIPIHANVGMGVGGVPMFEVPPADVVTRAGVALIEIGKADGL
jgi:dimethylamine--corrinoid protein Co-methyltransferase